MEKIADKIAFTEAKEVVKDGYHVVDFYVSKNEDISSYNLCHDNGNIIKIVSSEKDGYVRIFKNNKLKKEINL